MQTLLKTLIICLSVILLAACVNKHPPEHPNGTESYLENGKRLFEQQHYKEAMQNLLPLACDCVPEAEYAVGYMYYNGYGVAQDTDVGTFWIRRAAQHGYQPANVALQSISMDKYHHTRSHQWPRGF
jgi:TPR repeat protein